MPPELAWLSDVLAGQNWPASDEDGLSAISAAWYEAANGFVALANPVGDVSGQVSQYISGDIADQFSQFMTGLANSLPQMADTANSIGDMMSQAALEVQYAKLMILVMMFWAAEQIIEWASTVWGLAVVPEIEAAAQITISTIAKQLLKSVLTGVVTMVGADAAIQGLQFLMGDRHQWNSQSTLQSLEMGALAGAIGGVIHIGGGALAPDFAKSFLGHVTLGGITGLTVGELSNLAFGSDQNLGLAFAAGAAGGALGSLLSHDQAGDTSVAEDLPKAPEFDDPLKVTALEPADLLVTEPPATVQAPPSQAGSPDEGTATGGTTVDLNVSSPLDISTGSPGEQADPLGLSGQADGQAPAGTAGGSTAPADAGGGTVTTEPASGGQVTTEPAGGSVPAGTANDTTGVASGGSISGSSASPSASPDTVQTSADVGLTAGASGPAVSAAPELTANQDLTVGENPQANQNLTADPLQAVNAEATIPAAGSVGSDSSTAAVLSPGPDVTDQAGGPPMPPTESADPAPSTDLSPAPPLSDSPPSDSPPSDSPPSDSPLSDSPLAGDRPAESGSLATADGSAPQHSGPVQPHSGPVHQETQPYVPADATTGDLFGGTWTPPPDRGGDVVVIKTSEPVELKSGDGRPIVTIGRENEVVWDRNTNEAVAYRQVRGADGERLPQPRTFLRDSDGGWTEHTTVGAATYEGWLATANGAHDAARTLRDIAARSGPDVPENERLTNLSDTGLRALMHGSRDDAIAAIYETVRRGEGVSLRWTQLSASHALTEGKIVNMAAGEGKSWLFLVDAARQAVRPDVDAVHVITTRGNLADREFEHYQKVLGSMGFDVHRMNPDSPPPGPRDGVPTIYIGTHQDVGFTVLKTDLVPGQRASGHTVIDASVDEIDEAFVYSNTHYILAEGMHDKAPAEVAGPVKWATGFLADRLRTGELTDTDFGREPGQSGGPARLTADGLDKAEELLGRPLTQTEVARLNMAATAHWEYAENVHYVLHNGKIFIIDQTTHEVLYNPETATESRWNGGLAQAIESKHGLEPRDDPKSSKSITAQELYSKDVYNRVTGASGTASHKGEIFARQGLSDQIVDIPRYYSSRLVTHTDQVSPDLAGKLSTIASDVRGLRESTGQPQLILAHRNDLVAKLSELLGDDVPHTAIDAKWFLAQGGAKEREAAFKDVIAKAGEKGSVLVINMQGARGVDIPVSEAAKALGGLHVRVTARSGTSPDIDIQAENRAARSGDPGSVSYYLSPDDEVFRLSANPDVEHAVIQYASALRADTTASTPDTSADLDHAEQTLRELVPDAQAEAARRMGMDLGSHLPNAPPASEAAGLLAQHQAASSSLPDLSRPPPSFAGHQQALLTSAGQTFTQVLSAHPQASQLDEATIATLEDQYLHAVTRLTEQHFAALAQQPVTAEELAPRSQQFDADLSDVVTALGRHLNYLGALHGELASARAVVERAVDRWHAEPAHAALTQALAARVHARYSARLSNNHARTWAQLYHGDADGLPLLEAQHEWERVRHELEARIPALIDSELWLSRLAHHGPDGVAPIDGGIYLRRSGDDDLAARGLPWHLGWLTVAGHFERGGVVLGDRVLSAVELAALVRSQPGWDQAAAEAGRKPGVILVSCGAAESSGADAAFAAEFAAELEAEVLAATGDLEQQPDGSVLAVKAGGDRSATTPRLWLFDPFGGAPIELDADLTVAVGMRAGLLGPVPAIAVSPPAETEGGQRWGPKLEPVPEGEEVELADMPSTSAPDPGLPARIAAEGRLSASDTVVSLFPGDTAPWQAIKDLLSPVLGSSWNPVAEVLEPMFDSALVKPMLSVLARGGEWKLPIHRGEWQGFLTLDARVLPGLGNAQDVAKLEFQGGSESQMTMSGFAESQGRVIYGLPVKLQDAEIFQNSGTASRYHEWTGQRRRDATSRTVSKSKTVEPAVSFTGNLEIGVRVSLKHLGIRTADPANRHAVQVGARIAVPQQDIPAHAAQDTHYPPPQRIRDQQRFGSSDVIWDVHPLVAGRPAGTGEYRTALTAAIGAQGQAVFGSHWDSVTDAIIDQVDLVTLQQRLIAMGSGEPISVHLGSVAGSVKVTARVVKLSHVRSTAQTEFNTGTETLRTATRLKGRTDASQLPAPGLFELLQWLPFDLGFNSAWQGGHDTLRLYQDFTRTGIATKTKVPGEVFDGEIELRFEMRGQRAEAAAVVATANLGVRAVVERAEITDPGGPDPVGWEADAPPAPRGPLTTAEPAAEDLPVPPPRVWAQERGLGGLKDTYVVRDLFDLGKLRTRLSTAASALFGAEAWKALEPAVLDAFSRDQLMANLAAMTRQIPLEGPELDLRSAPPGADFKATARVARLIRRRTSGKGTQLAPQGDAGTQSQERGLDWWQVQASLQPGGQFTAGGSTDTVLANVGGLYRRRTGWRTAAGGRVVANSKFPVNMVIFDGEVELRFQLSADQSGGVRTRNFTVMLPFEVAIPAGELRLLTAGGAAAWNADPANANAPVTSADYGRLEQLLEADPGLAQPAIGYLVTAPAKDLLPPRRLTDGRLGGSDFVLSFPDDGNDLVERISGVLAPALGAGWRKSRRDLRAKLDTAAVKPLIPAMSNGDAVVVPVSGNGWSGNITVTASVRDLNYHEPAPGVEFQNGTVAISSGGASVEGLHRKIRGALGRYKTPNLTVTVQPTRETDTNESLVAVTGGQTTATAKTVEDGAVFGGQVVYHVSFNLSRAGFRFNAPDNAREVAVAAHVMVPERDALLNTPDGPKRQVPAPFYTVPGRISQQFRLSSSDVVQDVTPQLVDRTDVLPQPQPDGTTGVAALLVSVQNTGKEVFGWHWASMRRKILAEVSMRRIQYELKGMMARAPIQVDAPFGVRGKVTITAELVYAGHASNTAQTEFNTGAARNRMRTAEEDPDATASSSVGTTVQAQGTTPPIHGLPIAGSAGATVTGRLGHDELDLVSTATSTAATTKAKVAGVAFDGLVVLRFRLEHQPGVGRARVRRASAKAVIRFLSEEPEAIQVDAEAKAVFTGARPEANQPPAAITGSVRQPPERIWRTGADGGLRDTDVVRGLPDVGGLYQAAEIEVRKFFGDKLWRKIAGTVRGGLRHDQLSAALTPMSRGEVLLSPLALGRLLHPDAKIAARAQVVRAEYRRVAKTGELNIVNQVSRQDSQASQYWWVAGLTGQGGVQVGFDDFKLTVNLLGGGQYRSRKATLHASSGRVVSNAKFAEPTVIYDAEILVTLTLQDGSKTREIKGVIPAQLGIPLAEHTADASPGVTVFHAPGEETLRAGQAAIVLRTARTEAAANRLLATARDRTGRDQADAVRRNAAQDGFDAEATALGAEAAKLTQDANELRDRANAIQEDLGTLERAVAESAEAESDLVARAGELAAALEGITRELASIRAGLPNLDGLPAPDTVAAAERLAARVSTLADEATALIATARDLAAATRQAAGEAGPRAEQVRALAGNLAQIMLDAAALAGRDSPLTAVSAAGPSRAEDLAVRTTAAADLIGLEEAARLTAADDLVGNAENLADDAAELKEETAASLEAARDDLAASSAPTPDQEWLVRESERIDGSAQGAVDLARRARTEARNTRGPEVGEAANALRERVTASATAARRAGTRTGDALGVARAASERAAILRPRAVKAAEAAERARQSAEELSRAAAAADSTAQSLADQVSRELAAISQRRAAELSRLESLGDDEREAARARLEELRREDADEDRRAQEERLAEEERLAREAGELRLREEREREERAAREAQERAAREAADREAREAADREAEDRQAREAVAREQQAREREARERTTRENLDRQARIEQVYLARQASANVTAARSARNDAATRAIQRDGLDGWLAGSGLRRVEVRADGNCTFHGLIQAAGNVLSQLFGSAPLTPALLRDYLVRVLRQDRELELAGQPTRYGGMIREREGQSRPDAWDEHITWLGEDGAYRHRSADIVLNILSHEFGLPLMVAHDNRVDRLGPDGDIPYVLINRFEHYWATETRGDRQPRPSQVPPDEMTARIDALDTQFTWLRRRLRTLLPGVEDIPDAETRDTLARMHEYVLQFEQIMDQRRPDWSVQSDSSWQQQRFQRLAAVHRSWVSAARNLYPQLAESEDIADLTYVDLEDWAVTASQADGGAVPTPSGYYFPGHLTQSHEEVSAEHAAATSFPHVPGATVLHLHADDEGYFLVSGRRLTPEQFDGEVLANLAIPAGSLVIVVACQAGRGDLDSAAMRLARRRGQAVLAPVADAFTTAGGQVVSARQGVDTDGFPLLDLAEWALALPGEARGIGAVAAFGGELLTVLNSGALDPYLGAPPVRPAGPFGVPPARDVRWSGSKKDAARQLDALNEVTEEEEEEKDEEGGGVRFDLVRSESPVQLDEDEEEGDKGTGDARRTGSSDKKRPSGGSLPRRSTGRSVPSSGGSRRSSQGSQPSLPRAASLIRRPAQLFGSDPDKDLGVPWWVARGAHGEMEIMSVLPGDLSEAQVRAAALGDATAFVTKHAAAIETALGDAGINGIRQLLEDVLAITETEEWSEVLQWGTLAVLGGKTVWLRYRLTDAEVRGRLELPPRQKRFRVNFSGQTAEWEKSRAGELNLTEALDLAVGVASSSLAAVSAALPSVTSKNSSQVSWGGRTRVVGGRKQRAQDYQPFDVRLAVELYVDGIDILAGRQPLTAGRHLLTVGFQAGLVRKSPDDRPDLRDVRDLSEVNADELRHFDLVLDAAGISLAVPPMIAALRRAGLSAQASMDVAGKLIRQVVNEQSVLNRSHAIPGKIVSTPFSVPHGMGRFTGTASLTLRPGLLRHWREVDSTLRYDIGWEGQLKRGSTITSGLSVRTGAELVKLQAPGLGTAGYLGVALTFSHDRGSSSQSGLDQGTKTTLLWGGQLELFAGFGSVEITFTGNVAVEPVKVQKVPIQLAVHRHEAAEFAQRVLGLSPAAPSRPLAVATLRPEPAMVRDLRGQGFGVLRKLPGGSDVVKVMRDLLRRAHVDPGGIDHALEYWFGQEALEAMDVSGLAHGVVRTLTGQGKKLRIDLAVQMRLAKDVGTRVTPVDDLTINQRSLSGASSADARFAETEVSLDVGGRARLKVNDDISVDLVTAEGNGSLAWGNSQSLEESITSYVRTETEGPAQDFAKAVYFVVAVRVKGSFGTVTRRRYLWDMGELPAVSEPDFTAVEPTDRRPYTAVISASTEVLPSEEPAPDQQVAVQVFHQARPDVTPDFHAFKSPAAGVYPFIAAMPELALAVATMLARAKGAIKPTERITDLLDVPQQINDITSPAFLQAHLVAELSEEGFLVTLEPDESLSQWIDPAENALRIKIRLYDVADINEGTDAAGPHPVEVERYVSNTTTSGQAHSKRRSGAVSLLLGPRVKLDNSKSEDSGLLDANSSVRPVNHFSFHGGGRVSWTRESESGRQQGSIQVARATYKQVKPKYWKADDGPIEQTQTLLLKGGMWLDFELVSKRALTKRVTLGEVSVRADNAVNLLAPGPIARVLFRPQYDKVMARLAAALSAVPRYVAPGRTYIDPEAALKLSAVESVSAKMVLPAIVDVLLGHGVSDAGKKDDVGSQASKFRQKLEARFSESALERRFPQLINGGIVAWIPLRTGFGTIYIGIRVSALVTAANADEVAKRLQTFLMIRTEPTDRSSEVLKNAWNVWGGFSTGAIKVLGSALGGLAFHAGYEGGKSYGSEELHDRTDFYRITSTSGTYAFTHGLNFQIEVAASWTAPEIFRLPIAGLKSLWLLPGLAEQGRTDFWFDHTPWAWHEEKEVKGQATFLVLGELTREVTDDEGPNTQVLARSPEPVLTGGQWLGPLIAPARRSAVNDELMTLAFIPLAFPAAKVAEGLVPWLLAPRLRGRPLADLLAIARRGFDLGHMRGARNARANSAAMLTAQFAAMLRPAGYEFTVSGKQPVTLRLNLGGVTYLPASVVFKDRLYSQSELSTSVTLEQLRALGIAFSLEPGGYGNLLFEGSAGPGGRWESSRGLGGEGGDIGEYDVETTRTFYFVSLDIELLMDAGAKGGFSGNLDRAVRLALPETDLIKLIEIAVRHGIRRNAFPAEVLNDLFAPAETELAVAQGKLAENLEKVSAEQAKLTAERTQFAKLMTSEQEKLARDRTKADEEGQRLGELRDQERARATDAQNRLKKLTDELGADRGTFLAEQEQERVRAKSERDRLRQAGEDLDAAEQDWHRQELAEAERVRGARLRQAEDEEALDRARRRLADDRRAETSRIEEELRPLELAEAMLTEPFGSPARDEGQAEDLARQRHELENALAAERTRAEEIRLRLDRAENDLAERQKALVRLRAREEAQATENSERLTARQIGLRLRHNALAGERRQEDRLAENNRAKLTAREEQLEERRLRLEEATENERAQAAAALGHLADEEKRLTVAAEALAVRRKEAAVKAARAQRRLADELDRLAGERDKLAQEEARLAAEDARLTSIMGSDRKPGVTEPAKVSTAKVSTAKVSTAEVGTEAGAGPAKPKPEPDKKADADQRAQQQKVKDRALGQAVSRARWHDQVQRAYRQLTADLGLEQLDVAMDGDCFYNSVIVMFPEQMLRLTGRRSPRPATLRTLLANELERDFRQANAGEPYLYAQAFPGTTTESPDQRRRAQQRVLAQIRQPGSWNNDAGDTVAELAARIWQLPITLLGRNYPVDVGPDLPGRRYLLYTGTHYMGARTPDDRVRTAADLLNEARRAGNALAPLLEADFDVLAAHWTYYFDEFNELRSRLEWMGAGTSASVDLLGEFARRLAEELSQEAINQLAGVHAQLETLVEELTSGKAE
jgi:hypothetical protein